jgi:hypothetical protein
VSPSARTSGTNLRQVSPGTRVALTGVYSVLDSSQGGNSKDSAAAKQAAVAVRTPYLRVVGVEVMSSDSGRTAARFSAEEEEECLGFARSPGIYERIVSSIAPAISGDYTDDIKKAIACLLFGGTRRKLPDGVRLRGDINVLLLGDPSTAKSQFLKFAERVAPVGVYTSGKGSSAAGLTASVVRDARGEFFLEGWLLGRGSAPLTDSRSAQTLRRRRYACVFALRALGGGGARALVAGELLLTPGQPWCSRTAAWYASTSLTRCASKTAWRSMKPWSSRRSAWPRRASPPS